MSIISANFFSDNELTIQSNENCDLFAVSSYPLVHSITEKRANLVSGKKGDSSYFVVNRLIHCFLMRSSVKITVESVLAVTVAQLFPQHVRFPRFYTQVSCIYIRSCGSISESTSNYQIFSTTFDFF